MIGNNNSENPYHSSLNTLAQNGTGTIENPAIILTGKGSDLTNSKALKGRAKRKLITQKMMLALMDIEEKKGLSENKKGYWNTYHCQSNILTAKGKLFGKYCKNRYCTLCCAIRKASIINRYLPVIQTWSEPYFVTLTVKAVSLGRLNEVMKAMIRGIRKITNKHRKRYQRGKGIRLMGIRSLECNFNPIKRTYNPHYHLIVPDSETADILVNDWLKIWTSKWTSPKAQKISKVFNNQIALIETVKYGSKTFTEPELDKKVRQKGSANIHVSALSNIFNAMKGLRIFERFGFNQPEGSAQKQASVAIVKEYEEWTYDIRQFDWISQNGKKLADYNPVIQLIETLNNRIDILLE